MPEEITLAEVVALDKLPAIIEAREKLPTFTSQVNAINVIDEESDAMATALVSAIVQEKKAITAEHDRICKLTDQAHKEAVARRKAALEPWDGLLTIVEGKSKEWVREETRKRQEQERRDLAEAAAEAARVRAEEEAKVAKRKALLEKLGGDPDIIPEAAPAAPIFIPRAPDVPRTVQTADGHSVTRTMAWFVQPIAGREQEIPMEYCKKVPQQVLLNAAIARGVREIPGCRVWEDVKTTKR